MRILSSGAERRELVKEFAEFQLSDGSPKAIPPSNNMGGTSIPPPTPQPGFVVQKTKIDWLAFTTSIEIVPLKILVCCLFDNPCFHQQDKGMFGYPMSYTISVNDVNIGVIGFGADHGKNYVSITGVGCGLFPPDFGIHILDVLQTADAKLTRLDLALDFYNAELTYEDCFQAYESLEFKLPKSPKNPTCKEVGTRCGDVNLGRTLYVGARKGSKMVRCYEKGLQVFAGCSDAFREACTDPGSLVWGEAEKAPEGTIADRWLRVEVEYKSVDVHLDLEMVVETDKYFSGAYPFCERVLGLGDGLRPLALKPSLDVDLHKLISAASRSYGSLVHTLSKVGYSDAMIKEALSTGKHNNRLVRAGVLSRIQSLVDFDIPF